MDIISFGIIIPQWCGRSIYYIDSVSSLNFNLRMRLLNIFQTHEVCDHPILIRKFVDRHDEGEDVVSLKKWKDEPMATSDRLGSGAMSVALSAYEEKLS